MAIKISGDTVIDDLKNWLGNPMDASFSTTTVFDDFQRNVATFNAHNPIGNISEIKVVGLDDRSAIIFYVDVEASSKLAATVVSLYDGKVKIVKNADIDTGTCSNISAVKLKDNQVVVAYNKSGNGVARVVSVSDDGSSTIVPYTSYTFNAAATSYTAITRLSDSLCIVAFRNSTTVGTAVSLSITGGTTITPGTPFTFSSNATGYVSITELDDSKAVVCYTDLTSSAGEAIVLTHSGGSITGGTTYTFDFSVTSYNSVDTVSSNKVIVAYKNVNGYGYCKLMTVSGTSLSVNSSIFFTSGVTQASDISFSVLNSEKGVVFWRDATSSVNEGQTRSININLTYSVISNGLLAPLTTGGSAYAFDSAALDGEKAIYVYRRTTRTGYVGTTNPYAPPYSYSYFMRSDAANVQNLEFSSNHYVYLPSTPTTKTFLFKNKGPGICTIQTSDEGTGLTLAPGDACFAIPESTRTDGWNFVNLGDKREGGFAGLATIFESANTAYISLARIDPGRAIVVYQDVTNSGYGTACVLYTSLIDDIMTIVAGTPVVFESASTTYCTVSVFNTDQPDAITPKAIVAYVDAGNSNYGTACILTISGTSTITATSPIVFHGLATSFMAVTTLNERNAVVAYRDGGNSNRGTCILIDYTESGGFNLGTSTVFDTSASAWTAIDRLDNERAVIAYNSASSYPRMVVVRAVGPDVAISVGTPVVSENRQVNTNMAVAALNPDMAVMFYRDEYPATPVTCIRCAKISGLTVTMEHLTTFSGYDCSYPWGTRINNNTVAFSYRNELSSPAANYAYTSILTYSEDGKNVISNIGPAVETTMATAYTSIAALDENKLMVAYMGTSNYGRAKIIVLT